MLPAASTAGPGSGEPGTTWRPRQLADAGKRLYGSMVPPGLPADSAPDRQGCQEVVAQDGAGLWDGCYRPAQGLPSSPCWENNTTGSVIP